MNVNRYLFLDIDGVLNSERTVAAYGKLTHAGRVKADLVRGSTPEPMFDSISVMMLAAAQRDLGFKIVISSTWRKMLNLQDFFTVFDLYGWDTRDIIIGKTGDEPGKRGMQIRDWMSNHAKLPYLYCIIDDDSDMLEYQLPFFVKTSFKSGISFDNFEQIYDIFGQPYKQVGSLPVPQIEQPD